MKLGKVGKYPFRAEQYQCNFKKRIFVSNLINQLLCAADYHSTEREFGTEKLNLEHKSWVLSRFAIQIERLPSRHEEYYIETWVESAKSFFTQRNFRARTPEGEIICYGRSVWAMIDTRTREPLNLVELNENFLDNFVITDEDVEAPIERPSRIPVENPVLQRTIDTYYNDIDFNGHVNSARYIEHVLDLFPIEWHAAHTVKRVDVAFVAESYCGDKLNFYMTAPKPLADGSTEYSVEIRRVPAEILPGGATGAAPHSCQSKENLGNSIEDKECCRCRIICSSL